MNREMGRRLGENWGGVGEKMIKMYCMKNFSIKKKQKKKIMVDFWGGSAHPGEPGICGDSCPFFISATWAHCPSTTEGAAGHQMHGISTMFVSATWCLSETSCWDREERHVSVGELVPPFGLVSPPKGECWKLNKLDGRKLSHEGQLTSLPPNSACSSDRDWWRGSWRRSD